MKMTGGEKERERGREGGIQIVRKREKVVKRVKERKREKEREIEIVIERENNRVKEGERDRDG